MSAWSGAADHGGRRGADACCCCQRGALCVGEYGNDAAGIQPSRSSVPGERVRAVREHAGALLSGRSVAARGWIGRVNGFLWRWVLDPCAPGDVHQRDEADQLSSRARASPTRLPCRRCCTRRSTGRVSTTSGKRSAWRAGLHGHVVLAWTGSETKALRAFDYSRRYAKQLESQYRTTNAACDRIAHARGIHPIKIEGGAGASDPSPPTPPPPAQTIEPVQVLNSFMSVSHSCGDRGSSYPLGWVRPYLCVAVGGHTQSHKWRVDWISPNGGVWRYTGTIAPGATHWYSLGGHRPDSTARDVARPLFLR